MFLWLLHSLVIALLRVILQLPIFFYFLAYNCLCWAIYNPDKHMYRPLHTLRWFLYVTSCHWFVLLSLLCPISFRSNASISVYSLSMMSSVCCNYRRLISISQFVDLPSSRCYSCVPIFQNVPHYILTVYTK